MLVSGSLVLMTCSSPSNPYRSAGLNRTCCAAVCGTCPVVTPAVGGGSAALAALANGPPAPTAAAARSAPAAAAAAAGFGGVRSCCCCCCCCGCGWSADEGAFELGGKGDEAELAAPGVPFGRRPAGYVGVCCGLCDHEGCDAFAWTRFLRQHLLPPRASPRALAHLLVTLESCARSIPLPVHAPQQVGAMLLLRLQRRERARLLLTPGTRDRPARLLRRRGRREREPVDARCEAREVAWCARPRRGAHAWRELRRPPRGAGERAAEGGKVVMRGKVAPLAGLSWCACAAAGYGCAWCSCCAGREEARRGAVDGRLPCLARVAREEARGGRRGLAGRRGSAC